MDVTTSFVVVYCPTQSYLLHSAHTHSVCPFHCASLGIVFTSFVLLCVCMCLCVCQVVSGSHSYMLKEKNCVSQSRGILCVETEFVYQPMRALVRTVQPRDNSSQDMETKFQRKVSE